MTPNQKHVSSPEVDLEQQRWKIVSSILRHRCNQNQISFYHRVNRFNFIENHSKNKILLSFLFDCIDINFVRLAAEHCSKLGKKLYVITDSWIDPKVFYCPGVKLFSLPKLFGLTALPGKLTQSKTPTKLFNAFFHRADATRQSWFYFLYLRNLLDKGYVSYRLYQINTNITGQQLYDQIHNAYLSKVEHFNNAYFALRNSVPYSNFGDADNLGELILNTKYSLVSDTYAVQDDLGTFYISEKVTRALQYPTVNLFFLQKNTLSKLVGAGLHVDPQLLKIDSLNWIDRQQQILTMLENNVIHQTLDVCLDQANHNRDILNNWLSQCLDSSFYDEVFDFIALD